jgi:uncharacterized protein YdhG (YjbR/CyaY superfamily)
LKYSKEDHRTVDEYIIRFPSNIQNILQKIRQLIKDLAPNAKETISYQIPTFKLNGNLVHFAAFRTHIGFYPTPSALEEFKKELSKYKLGKGTIQFPIDEPIPYDLIKKIVEFRINENLKRNNQKYIPKI